MKAKERLSKDHKFGQIISDKIKEFLDSRGLSYKKFETLAGLPTGSVYNLLSGNSSNPTIETVVAFADAMNCSIDELLNRDTKKDEIDTDRIDISELNRYNWNEELITQSVEAINNKLKEKSNPMKFGKGILLLNDIFSYSYSKNKFDQDFAKWLLNKL